MLVLLNICGMSRLSDRVHQRVHWFLDVLLAKMGIFMQLGMVHMHVHDNRC